MKKPPSFTKEFKLETVWLLERGDKSAADLARELGIPRNQLDMWQEQLSAREPTCVAVWHPVDPVVTNVPSPRTASRR